MPQESLGYWRNGYVAILDALGVSDFSDEMIERFLKARDSVLNALEGKVTEKSYELRRLEGKVRTHVFNDTLLITVEGSENASVNDIELVARFLRDLQYLFLGQGVMFRGVFTHGRYYEQAGKNTVLGPAVTDAALWYDKVNWFGVNATPRFSVQVDCIAEEHAIKKDLLIKYKVPLKSGGFQNVFSVNFPKIFWVAKSYRGATANPRQHFFGLMKTLPSNAIGAEKHANMISFFDWVQNEMRLNNEFQGMH